MAEPRYQRRKHERPQQIIDAAFSVFAEQGYAGARVEEVAKRAGVSKGLLYLYFNTKEELFKAVIKNVVTQRIDTLAMAVEETELSSEAFMRGPLLAFMQRVPRSPVAVVIRLLIAEGHRHPDLTDYYWNAVVSTGLTALTRIIERGVQRGEFRESAVRELPQLLVAPMMVAMVWRMLFSDRGLDSDELIATHIDMFIAYIRD